MAKYAYKAMDRTGKVSKGVMDGIDKAFVAAALKDKGLYAMEVSEETRISKGVSFGTNVKSKDLTIFCQQFEAALSAGITVLQVLDLLSEQTENKTLKEVVKNLYVSVEQGDSLAQGMKKHPDVFPGILINMIEAGERSGNLEVSLGRMAVHFEKEYKLQQSVRKATTYPIVVSVVAIGVIILLLVVVIPTFVTMFEDIGTELPATTKALIAMSDFVKTKWYVLIAVVTFAVVFIKYYGKSENGRMVIGQLKLNLPVFGVLNRKIVGSRFTRTLSTLLASGLPLLEALEIVAKVVDNYIVMQGLLYAREQVSKGMHLSKPINDMGVFPPMVTHMVRIGEDTGQLEEILNKVADFYDTEVETAVDQLTTMLEPLIIVALAGIVGFVILSIIQPMFQMYNDISNY